MGIDYITASKVPEPISLVLLGTGLVGVAAARHACVLAEAPWNTSGHVRAGGWPSPARAG